MGCAQSKIENEEAVSRCKERKHFMKDAIAARNAFAAAHSACAVALKNTGAALSDYAEAEAIHDVVHTSSSGVGGGVVASSASSSAGAAAVVKIPMDETLRPPPPLPPEFSSPSPLQRTASMPDLPIPKPRQRWNPNDQPSPAEASIREEEEGDDAEDDARGGAPAPEGSPAPPLRPPPQPEPTTAPPMPPPQHNDGSWVDFFGLSEHMRTASLAEPPPPPPPEEIRSAKDDWEEDAEKYRRSAPTSAKLGGGVDDLPPSPSMTPEKLVVEPPPPSPPKQVKKSKGSEHQDSASVASVDAKKGKMVPAAAPSVTLLQVLMQLDDHFLKASESAQEVSKMLEANRLHYHSNFAVNRGPIDHSARVMRAITWNRSFNGVANADDRKDVLDEWETHATILDRLLGWEKKLYDEVKASELMKLEYQRKVSLLGKQKKRGVNSESLERTKAAVSHLHTRCIVDMQSMDSIVSEIQRLRDDRLYPKLSALVDGMARMWETMFMHHEKQLQIVSDIRILDISNVSKETSEELYQRTDQLCGIVDEWHTQFQKLVSHQREYIKALNNWLRLNLIPTESSLKEVSSPLSVRHPPIQSLLQAWHDQLEKLPDERAKSSIHCFSAVIKAIKMNQEDELKQKEKCEEIHRDYIGKKQTFEDWHQKYTARRTTQSEESDPERTENANKKDLIAGKFAVEVLKQKLDDEVENYQKLCKQAREKSVYSLKSHLPELFRSISEFAQACVKMYGNLRNISQAHNGTTS